MIRGALSNLGVNCVVTAEVSAMPACKSTSFMVQLCKNTQCNVQDTARSPKFFKRGFSEIHCLTYKSYNCTVTYQISCYFRMLYTKDV